MPSPLRCCTRPGVPVALMLLACSSPTPPRELSTELVSEAGGCSISPEPILDVPSSVDGEVTLTDVTDATRLRNGMIAVADKFSDRVALFESNGALIRYLGRSGSGPGEFKGPQWVGECEPGVLTVFDFMSSRLITIDTDGRVVAQRSLTPRPLVMDCNLGGVLAYIVSLFPDTDDDKVAMLKSDGFILDRSGTRIGSLGTVPAASQAIVGGRAVIAVAESVVIYGSSERTSLDLYDFSGSRIGSRDVGMSRRIPRPAHVDGWVESSLEQVARSATDSIIRVMLRRLPTAELLPAYRSVHADEQQNLWVVTSAAGDSVTELRVLPADDREPVTLRVAGDMKLFEVRDGYLLGRRVDDAGVPHLVVYRTRSEKQ